LRTRAIGRRSSIGTRQRDDGHEPSFCAEHSLCAGLPADSVGVCLKHRRVDPDGTPTARLARRRRRIAYERDVPPDRELGIRAIRRAMSPGGATSGNGKQRSHNRRSGWIRYGDGGRRAGRRWALVECEATIHVEWKGCHTSAAGASDAHRPSLFRVCSNCPRSTAPPRRRIVQKST